MDTMSEAMKLLKFDVTEEQYIAALFLESRHQRFCVEFGILTAVEKADRLFDEECAKIRIQ